MTRPSLLAAGLGITIASSLAAPAIGWASPITVPASGGGIQVTQVTTVLYDVTTVTLPPGVTIGSADVIISQGGNRVWIDEDSLGDGPVPHLVPGVGCRQSTEFPAGMGVVCTFDRARVHINLRDSTYSGGELTFTSLGAPTTFSGSPHDDEFYGGAAQDNIDGAGGDDILFGGDGDDWILGGDGADRIDGEGGEDTIFGNAGPDDITVDEDGKVSDWVNCNDFALATINSDNDPDNPPINRISYDAGIDRITDCGISGAPQALQPPTLSGTPRVGADYTASPGLWEGKGLITTYSWFRCPSRDDTVPMVAEDDDSGRCTMVWDQDGDEGRTYSPTAADVGGFLRLRTTARNNAGLWTEVSEPSPAVETSQRPGMPRIKRVTIDPIQSNAQAARLTVRTTAPKNSGGLEIESYRFRVSLDRGRTWQEIDVAADSSSSEAGATSSAVMSPKNLTMSDRSKVRVKVRVLTGAGFGPWSKAARVST